MKPNAARGRPEGYWGPGGMETLHYLTGQDTVTDHRTNMHTQHTVRVIIQLGAGSTT